MDTQFKVGDGQRIIDIVAQRGTVLAIVEVKANGSAYEPIVRARDAVVRLAYDKLTGQKLAGYLIRVRVNSAGMITRVTVRDSGTGRIVSNVFRPGRSGVGTFLGGFGGGGGSKRAKK